MQCILKYYEIIHDIVLQLLNQFHEVHWLTVLCSVVEFYHLIKTKSCIMMVVDPLQCF